MDFVILDKVLTTVATFTPPILYGGLFYNLLRFLMTEQDNDGY